MANDLWATPPEVIAFVETFFGKIKIDLCASDGNALCSSYITEKGDFLDDFWIKSYLHIRKGSTLWCNPPYSNPLPFIKQMIKWSKAGYGVATILNLDPSTKWFVELQRHASIIMPIVGGRISFLAEDQIPIKGNNKPQVIAYFQPFGMTGLKTQKTIYINIGDIYKDRL